MPSATPPRILLAALLAAAALACSGPAAKQIVCLDPGPVNAGRIDVPIVDAATGARLGDAAVSYCAGQWDPDAPAFRWFGSGLFSRAPEPIGWVFCAHVSHPDYEAVEVRVLADQPAEDGSVCGSPDRPRVTEVRLRKVPGAPRPLAALVTPADRAWIRSEVFAAGDPLLDIEFGDPPSPGTARAALLGALREQGVSIVPFPRRENGSTLYPGVMIRPVEGEFDAFDDPRLAALARRSDVEAVGWALGEWGYCGRELWITPRGRVTEADLEAAVARVGGGTLRREASSGPHTFVVDLDASPGIHRGVVERARQLAAALPPGSAVGFVCPGVITLA